MLRGVGRRHDRARLRGPWIVFLALALLWAVAVGTSLWSRQPDEWVTLIETGDTLATGGGTMAIGRDSLTARTAYLLAFHHAQDREDVPRMLVAAERLERLGEHDLAAHTRHVARILVQSGPTRE